MKTDTNNSNRPAICREIRREWKTGLGCTRNILKTSHGETPCASNVFLYYDSTESLNISYRTLCVIQADSLAVLGATSRLPSLQRWYDQPTDICYLPSFGSKFKQMPRLMSILPRHLPAGRLRGLSCNTVMVSFDELSKGLQNMS